MAHFILFGTSACHLCEHAEQVLAATSFNNPGLAIEKIDIAEQPQWQALYATRIPVLYHPPTQTELGWPFNLAEANAFITKAITND